MPRATFHTLRSPHGHDSFLIEIDKLNSVWCAWRDSNGAACADAEWDEAHEEGHGGH